MSMSERAPAASTAAGDTAGAGRAMGAAEKVKERLRETTHEVTERTRRVAETARSRVADEFRSAAKNGAGCLAKGARDVSDALDEACNTLREREDNRAASYVGGAAEGIRRASRYLEERSPDQIAEDAGGVVRRHPAMVLGGVFAAGLLAGRFLRASAPEKRESRRAERAGEGDGGSGDADRYGTQSYGASAQGYGASSQGYGAAQGAMAGSTPPAPGAIGSSPGGSTSPTSAPDHTGQAPYRAGSEGSEAL